ncbi:MULTISPECIES: PTS system mannose/fructose/N-acetylgalactosamine-transporter subunit IIB [Streptomyces]|uniref:PTS system mannose-specific IIB component n=3 Tax=Streptomyces TaxID=1883 RepID=A0ABT9KW42_9ACTN|nr:MULTISPECIES: PTS sugar transporter subunit IIB [Streptomyces]MBW8093577.1 PTS sugar transporter subunit IIB [Streptomyces hygroscopicus subsp. hygroscopicus]MDN3058921.1 PTS sugar transporter subunit IIB [Streptomyces sp. SRF1]MDP9612661.1 PTS system mannose-specific IIB component [Streptomyces demainii]GHJ26825.1 PTS mannose transporter subunit IID [Streptomyces hygroscopicus]
MAIVEVRIDDRLIHGQVSNLWVPHFGVERLLVVDDAVAADEDRKAVLRFACPPQCKLSVFDTAKAAEKLSRGIDAGIRVMIVAVGPIPLLRMQELGYRLPSITVGNMSRRPGTRQVANLAYANGEELAAFQGLLNFGVTLAFQPTPTSRREDLTAAVTKMNEGH